MKLADVPKYPAYLVFHDAFDGGAMDVYPSESIEQAEKIARERQEKLEQTGSDECGGWKAYEKLPRVRVHKLYAPKVQA